MCTFDPFLRFPKIVVFYINVFIYLAAPGLSCSMGTLSHGMWDLVP